MPQCAPRAHDLKIVELHREDLPSIGRLLGHLRGAPHRFLLFCDDLSFSQDDQHYKSLKAVLDGGIEGRPENVRALRHLEPPPPDAARHDRERASTAINPSEAVEEKVSLSDRFGLWLGFHPCSQDDYLAMIRGYCDAWAWRSPTPRCGPRRSSGRRRGAAGRGGWPGSSSPTLRAEGRADHGA